MKCHYLLTQIADILFITAQDEKEILMPYDPAAKATPAKAKLG